jgi:hypothetical protein
MEPFNGNTPNLINNKILKDIELDLTIPFEDKSNNMINGIGTFYLNYIESNLFPLIVISLLILYLTIKYILKRDREENEGLYTEDSDMEETKPIIKKIQSDIYKPPIQYGNNISDKTDISDMISDDYLLTDDTITKTIADASDNNIDILSTSLGLQNVQSKHIEESITQLPLTGMIGGNIQNNEPVYNINKATNLVFGN